MINKSPGMLIVLLFKVITTADRVLKCITNEAKQARKSICSVYF